MANSRTRSIHRLHAGRELWGRNRQSFMPCQEGEYCLLIDTNTHVCADLVESLKRVRNLGSGKVVIAGAKLRDASQSVIMFGLPGKNPEFTWKDDPSNGVYTIEFNGENTILKSVPGWTSRDWMDTGVRRILEELL